jgi:hypothetical protein
MLNQLFIVSWNSCSPLNWAWELRKLSWKLSCNSCSRLTGTWDLRKLLSKLSLLNSHATLVLVWPGHENWETLMETLASQLLSTLISCNSCSLLTWAWELRKLSCKLSLLNSHATLVLVRLGYESWVNSHANSRFSTLMQLLFSFLTGTWDLRKLLCKLSLLNAHATLVLAWPGHENWENSHGNSRFSTLINSHATLVLVWPGHENWENSHANSRLPTLINSHVTLVLVWPGMRIEKTLMQTLASQREHQLSCNSCSRLIGAWELRKLSCKLSLLNSNFHLTGP